MYTLLGCDCTDFCCCLFLRLNGWWLLLLWLYRSTEWQPAGPDLHFGLADKTITIDIDKMLSLNMDL